MTRRIPAVLAVATAALAASAASAAAAPIAIDDVVVYRIGTGTGSLLNTGSPVFLDEYTPAGALVQSIALPTADAGANQTLIASGTATSEGLLTRSANGRYLVATGYDRSPGGLGTISGTTSATVPRVVGLIDQTGAVDTTTALTDTADTNNVRSAVTVDGSGVWVSGGSGGLRYAAKGATTSQQVSSTTNNLRALGITDGQLYTSSASGALRVATVGTGLPTAPPQTIANLPGTDIPALPSPYGFAFFDLNSVVPGVDTLYVADDGAAALRKFSLVGGSWVSNGSVGADADDYRGVAGSVGAGPGVKLVATRKGGSGATGGGELVTLTDTAGYNGAFAGTPAIIATAAANTAFRGVALAPIALTAVSWAGGKAVRSGKGNLVTWKAGRDASNLGFDVLRVRSGKRVKLTRSLVGGTALRGPARTFAYRDVAGRARDRYLVVARGVDGSTDVHGPFAAKTSR